MSRFVCSYDGVYEPARVEALCEALHVQPLTARALIRRGLAEAADAQTFLAGEAPELLDPFCMTDMDKAATRLNAAFNNRETICIYGDYDADGICAVAILLDCFRAFTDRVSAYIPSREGEGYGLNAESVYALRERGVQLIVTVDNGISALDEIALCTSLGMDVIVTDHHHPPDTLPVCEAVVTPPDEACGAGVALRLARALAGDERLRRWLPMAALATVADVVPLTGDNRALVRRGLPLVEENPGLDALLSAAGSGGRAVDAATLAYVLAPRLNAAGRLGDAMRGVRLLLADDAPEAGPMAAELNEVNALRRAIEAEILADAEAMLAICEGKEEEPARALLLRHRDWHTGVIGIVASRLCEKWHRPVILFSENEQGVLTGSGRSIDAVDLYAALSACARHFVHFGGHASAAGLTMRAEAFDAFLRDFLAYLGARYDSRDFIAAQRYDETVRLEELSLAAVLELQRLAPFGEGNSEPVYRLCELQLAALKPMGEGKKHLCARACTKNASLRLVGFGFGGRLEELQQSGPWSLLVRPVINDYAGLLSVELVLVDAQTEEKLFDDFFREVLYNGVCIGDMEYLRAHIAVGAMQKSEDMRRMYQELRAHIGADGCALAALTPRFARETLCALIVFLELGFFRHESGYVRLVPDAEKRPLLESATYRLLLAGDGQEESPWT